MSTIYVEGRQFGLEDRIKLEANGKIVRETDASVWTLPVLRTKLWSSLHGYGWPSNGGRLTIVPVCRPCWDECYKTGEPELSDAPTEPWFSVPVEYCHYCGRALTARKRIYINANLAPKTELEVFRG